MSLPSLFIRNLAQSYIRSGLLHGERPTTLWNVLSKSFKQQYGHFYRKQEFFADVLNWKTVLDKTLQINMLPHDVKIPLKHHEYVTSYLTREYKYDVSGTLQNMVTGKTEIIHTSVSSSRRLSIDEIFDKAIEGIRISAQDSPVIFTPDRIVGAFKKKRI